MASVPAVDSTNFKREVLESDIPVMVDFWAEWCVPCRMIAPIVERLAQRYAGRLPIVERLAQRYAGRLKVVKLDVDANQDLAIEYQVMSIPTLLFFKNGQPVDRIIGAVGEQAIIQKIEELLQG